MTKLTLRIGDTNPVWCSDITVVTSISAGTVRALQLSDFTEAWHTIKTAPTDLDADRITWLRYTDTDLTFTAASGSIGARFDGELSASVFLSYEPGQVFYYDWQILVSGKPKTIGSGIYALALHVTHATS